MEENAELTQEDKIADLAAGYNDDAIIDTVDQVPEEETVEDPWAGVPETIKAKFGELSGKLSNYEKIEQRLRKSEGHIGDLIKKISAAQKQAESVPTPEQIEAIERDKAEVQSLKDLHGPELIEFLEKRDSRFADKIAKPADIANIRNELETNFNQRLTSVQAEFEHRLVGAVHPGWTDTVKGADFTGWMKEQPPEIQNLASSVKAEDAITLLNHFTRREAPVQSSRDERLARSVAPKKTSSSSKPLTLATMSPEQRRAYEIKQGYEDD